MSSNSGIRGTPLKTSDDEAELSPDSQIIEEEAGLSPNNQIKGYGDAPGVLVPPTGAKYIFASG